MGWWQQATNEARGRRPKLKVLFTTGYTKNAVVHNGVLDAGVDMIGKPLSTLSPRSFAKC